MARYTDDARDRVRDAVDFVDLVGSRVELRKAGVRRYVGLCPFHEERSPSFGIDPVEKLYHCFGCGAGGDVFKWVMELESLPFGEALEVLADRYGVTLERTEDDPRTAQRRARRERLHALLERAAAYYVRLLWEAAAAAPARDYLTSRGLEEPTLREFRVGYSPSAWDRIVAGSTRAGYTAEEVSAAGLASRSRDGRLIDRFRGRLMFPWTDTRGRVLGFGARAVVGEQQPKYLNSAEGEVFHKGRQVYGVDLARKDAARTGAVVLVEGYTDVIALHQAGLRNVVGQMGTALTPEQAAVLAGLAPTVLLCLDADAAGQQAMLRAAEVVRGLPSPPELRVVPLPSGSDPADVALREGPGAMRDLLDRAVAFPRWHVEHALAHGDLGTTEGRDHLLSAVAPVVTALPRGLLRQELVRLVADRLALSESLMDAALSQAAAPSTRRTAGRSSGAAVGTAVPSPTPVSRSRGGEAWRGRGRPGPRRDGAPQRGERPPGERSRPGERPPGERVPRPADRPSAPRPAAGSPPGPRHPDDDPFAVAPPEPDDEAAIAAVLAMDPGREDEAPTGAQGSGPAAPSSERARSAGHAGAPGTVPQGGPAAASPGRATGGAPGPGRGGGGPHDAGPSANPALRALDRRVEAEHAFLAFCLAFPAAGGRRLAALDAEGSFSSPLVRRAALHLREHLDAPSSGIPADDEPLTALVAELVLRARRLEDAEPSELDRAAYLLDLARLDRDIAAARAAGAPVSDLAIERQRVLAELRKRTR